MYFIPHDRLGEFQVADEDCAGAREALESLDSEVDGFAMGGLELKQGVNAVRAFQGPIGQPTPRNMTSAGDGIWQG